jgi:orotate phosphoribosyltransferase
MTMSAAHSAKFDSRAQDNGGHLDHDDDKRLADIIYRNSFGRGEVTLASGKKSDFYFDMKPSMLHPEGAHLMSKRILSECLNANAEYIGGLEMGAVPITGAVCQLSHECGRPVHGFFVRKAPKIHGAKKLIEGVAKSDSLHGKRVVIIDDVTTTGESALKAVAACRAEGANIVLVISVVDRQEGAAELFGAEGIRFTSLYRADEFLSRG